MKALLPALSFLLALTAPLPAADRAPNIVFIIADDLGYGDLGCYGQKIIQTPHLDRMAAEGARFTQMYSGNAVCAPSRCVLMSGLHPGRAFIRDNRQAKGADYSKPGIPEIEGQHPIPADTLTIPKVLNLLGYSTGGFGKWGLGGPGSTGEPLKQGFDRWYGYNCQGIAHNFYPIYLWDDDKRVMLENKPFPSSDKLRPDENPADPASYARFSGTQYAADLITEKALDFAKANKDRPFFIFWPTTVPHLALQVPEDSLKEYEGKFDDTAYPGGKGYLPHFKPRAAYAAMITRMDRDIGRMMSLIKEVGLDEQTIFIFTSDNGGLGGTHQGLGGTDAAFFNSCGGLRDGKGTLYEGGFRVPGIVRWSGKIKPTQVSDRVCGFEDWMPTLLELVGAKEKTPEKLDGISFAPTLLGQTQEARPFLYREFPGYGGQQCVRVGDWKAIRTRLTPRAGKRGPVETNTATPGKTQLYDLAKDPAETTDLAAQHPEIVAKLEAIMKAQHTPSRDFPFAALDQ
jgi:arylsulfatase A